MSGERELLAVLHGADGRPDVEVFSDDSGVQRLKGRHRSRMTLMRALTRAEAAVILPMLAPYGVWRFKSDPEGSWRLDQGAILLGANIIVTMHVLVRDGRALMLSTSDDRWGFELGAEDRALDLAEKHGTEMVVLKGWGYFLDEGLPTLTPHNSHEPMTWQVLEPHAAALAAAVALDLAGQYIDISQSFPSVARMSGDSMTREAVDKFKQDFREMIQRLPGMRAGFSISSARPVNPKKSITPSAARATHEQDQE